MARPGVPKQQGHAAALSVLQRDVASQQRPDEAFDSAAPIARLVSASADPFDNAVAAARTCYAPRIITADEVGRDERAQRQRKRIAQSTYAAGHHTVLQHATFQFALDNVSRQLIWSFLHAHPFYNSEQVSQRYVSVKPDKVLVPALPPRSLSLYRETVGAQMACYRDLVEILTEPARKAFFELFPARARRPQAHKTAILRKAQEVARYALPVATFAHLYHTVSGLTLHRYHRLSYSLDVPSETRRVVAAMIGAVRDHDPLFFDTIEDPVPLEQTLEYQALSNLAAVRLSPGAKRFCADFDRDLQGLSSRLLDYKVRGEELLARSVRTVLGASPDELDDDKAIALVMSPAENGYLSGALNLSSLSKLARAMAHPHYTFQKKLSHTADSQDQRHRMVPGTRPVLYAHYVGGEPDVVVPELLRRVPEAHDRFMATMEQVWAAIDTLLDDGVAPQMALYLLPNALSIRFEESGDLASLHHKWTTRLCYNAQEEIWRACLEEVQQVQQVHPRLGRYLEPPCGLRREAGQRPFCPEGPRFCGVSVWKQTLEQYERVI